MDANALGGGGRGRSGNDQTSRNNDSNDKNKNPVQCNYKLADPQPPAGSLDWEGHKPGDGAVYVQTCQYLDSALTVERMGWSTELPQAPAVNPAALAQQAVDKMRLLGPDIASPRAAGRYTVGVPMWMWVHRSAETYGPNTASASAGGVTVTATAKVSKIVWQMGDGTSVTCNGPGTPYQASEGMAQSPTCGHVYSKTSAGAQGGKYQATATSTWTIGWQGGGAAGQLTENRQSNVQVAIGEVQVVR
ncbi:ATP/GTP-binding protein [Streptomyces sp. V3I7]|uniref:ATP/GTP-binding protein n=1 Tax=Streptomyces sp. V3I7 TaxID=3042278 RepID=UPI0027D85167|nr:ATP/GTP-binding protein [Streptomyces sp. V3I7]